MKGNQGLWMSVSSKVRLSFGEGSESLVAKCPRTHLSALIIIGYTHEKEKKNVTFYNEKH
jgi:hypothetical protein